VNISRAQGSLTFLVSFQLIGSINPCPADNNPNALEIAKKWLRPMQ